MTGRGSVVLVTKGPSGDSSPASPTTALSLNGLSGRQMTSLEACGHFRGPAEQQAVVRR